MHNQDGMNGGNPSPASAMPLSRWMWQEHIAHNLFHLLAEGKSIFYTALTVRTGISRCVSRAGQHGNHPTPAIWMNKGRF